MLGGRWARARGFAWYRGSGLRRVVGVPNGVKIARRSRRIGKLDTTVLLGRRDSPAVRAGLCKARSPRVLAQEVVGRAFEVCVVRSDDMG